MCVLVCLLLLLRTCSDKKKKKKNLIIRNETPPPSFPSSYFFHLPSISCNNACNDFFFFSFFLQWGISPLALSSRGGVLWCSGIPEGTLQDLRLHLRRQMLDSP